MFFLYWIGMLFCLQVTCFYLGSLGYWFFFSSLVIIFQFLTISLHICFSYNVRQILKNYVFCWTGVESLEERAALPKMIILNVKFVGNTQWNNVFWMIYSLILMIIPAFFELLVENINKCLFYYMFCNIQKLIFLFLNCGASMLP